MPTLRRRSSPGAETVPALHAYDSPLATGAAGIRSRGWDALPKSYAIPEIAPQLHDAQIYCERLARSHYENFSVATWFLPKHLRQHFFNIYAYCRISDDLGDEVGNPAQSLVLLDEWQAELDRCYAGTPRHPVFVALRETVRARVVPARLAVGRKSCPRIGRRHRAVFTWRHGNSGRYRAAGIRCFAPPSRHFQEPQAAVVGTSRRQKAVLIWRAPRLPHHCRHSWSMPTPFAVALPAPQPKIFIIRFWCYRAASAMLSAPSMLSCVWPMTSAMMLC